MWPMARLRWPVLALGLEHRLVDGQRPAGVGRHGVEHARQPRVRRCRLRSATPTAMAPALIIGLQRPAGAGLQADRVEGVAGGLDADRLLHALAAAVLQRHAVDQRLGDRLQRERLARVADLVDLAVDGGDGDAEGLPGRPWPARGCRWRPRLRPGRRSVRAAAPDRPGSGGPSAGQGLGSSFRSSIATFVHGRGAAGRPLLGRERAGLAPRRGGHAPWRSNSLGVGRRAQNAHGIPRTMLINFFYTLRAAKLPVSVKEYLTLLEALKAGVIGPSVDDFYYLARTTLVKDEAQFDKFDRAFSAYFKGVRAADRLHAGRAAGMAAQDARARAQRRGEGGDREDGLGRADGNAEEALRGAEEAPRRRQQDDRHRRHQPVRRLRLQPAGHPHRPGQGPQPQRGQGLGPARLQGLRRHQGTRHAQHQGRAAPAAPLRARGLRARARPATTPSTAPRPMPGCWTSRWCPSATTR